MLNQGSPKPTNGRRSAGAAGSARKVRKEPTDGSWLTATIDYDPNGNLVGLSNGRIGSLRGLDGKPLRSKVMADAEGMALLPDGSWLVSFERHHRFWRYPTLDGTPTPIDGPADLDKQPDNGGVEAVTALGDGRIVAISEEYEVKSGVLRGWIGEPVAGGRYTWQTFDYVKTPDFNPTAPPRSGRAARCMPSSWRGSPHPMQWTISKACRWARARAARRCCG